MALKRVWGMMLELQKNYTLELYNKIWEYVYTYNTLCSDNEIFLCEDWTEDSEGKSVYRLYLEDDFLDYDFEG